jgi:hypothetical protein
MNVHAPAEDRGHVPICVPIKKVVLVVEAWNVPTL